MWLNQSEVQTTTHGFLAICACALEIATVQGTLKFLYIYRKPNDIVTFFFFCNSQIILIRLEGWKLKPHTVQICIQKSHPGKFSSTLSLVKCRKKVISLLR